MNSKQDYARDKILYSLGKIEYFAPTLSKQSCKKILELTGQVAEIIKLDRIAEKEPTQTE